MCWAKQILWSVGLNDKTLKTLTPFFVNLFLNKEKKTFMLSASQIPRCKEDFSDFYFTCRVVTSGYSAIPWQHTHNLCASHLTCLLADNPLRICSSFQIFLSLKGQHNTALVKCGVVTHFISWFCKQRQATSRYLTNNLFINWS